MGPRRSDRDLRHRQGAVAQQPVEAPPGVRVVVQDYDVDGCNESDLAEDENGDQYIESVWE